MPINPRVRAQRLSGINPLAYVGVDPVSPTNFVILQRAPTTQDYYNFNEGDEWLDSTTNDVWKLVNKDAQVATWILLTGASGAVTELTPDSGGTVQTDNSGNINLLGSGVISTLGNPGTHTVTIVPSGDIASAFDTIPATGTAVPTLGVLTFEGVDGIDISAATDIITIGTDGTIPDSFVTNPVTGTATPSAGILTFAGAGGTTVSAAGSTITITSTSTSNPVTTLHTDDGHDVTATANVINLVGAHGLNTTGTIGPNTATIAINNAITLGDLSGIAANSNALSATTGDLNIAAGNLKLPASNSTGTQGVIQFGGVRFIATNATDNQWFGLNAGNLAATGVNNLVLGGASLTAITTGTANTAVGNQIMATSGLTASNNTIIGSTAYHLGTDSFNTLVGSFSLAVATSAQNNTCIGGSTGYDAGSGLGLITGDGNVMIGYTSGSAYRGAESDNILIGSSGVVGESNVFRVANSLSAITKSFIEGIRGVTTVNNNAVAVLIDSVGQLGTVSSSLRLKENIGNIGSISEGIHALRPVIFNYKQHPIEAKNFGLIAEEVHEVMPQLVVYDKEGLPETIKYHELPVLLINEIQKLLKRIEALESK